MSKITLNNVGSLIDATTAQTVINNNSDVIEVAMDNTLSRDGTAPNTMGAILDMNSNQVLNLPTPATANSPLRLQDLTDFIGGGTVTNIPVGGNTKDMLVKTSNANYAVGWGSVASELVAGNQIGITGTSPATIAVSTTPTFTTVNGLTITSSTGTLTVPNGVTLTGPAASGTAMTLGNNETVTGVKTFGAAGNVGKLAVAGTTSGSTIVNATAVASGTLTLPAVTDTLIGKATTDTLTNKTYDTAAAGNSFLINGLAATANTGTGSVVRATSPTLVTPALGTPTALVLTSATGLPLATGVTGNLPTANAPLVSAFSVHKNGTDQTGIVSATATALTWSTELFDVGNNFASNTWTPPAGKVTMTAVAGFSGTITAGANCAIFIFKNGSTFLQSSCNPFTNAGGALVTIVDIANGTDAYTVQIYITTSAGTATVTGLAAQTRFMGHWISP